MLPIRLVELAHFLRTAQWPEEIERRPTFFSIAGFPHYENVMSNVYQFFFRTDNPHGLGSLGLDALLDVVRSKQEFPWLAKDTFRNVHALRELGVNDQQRLDLLLHNGPTETDWDQATAVVLIENKVYHWLANNLGNYWQSVSSAAIGDHKIGVVLGLRPERLPASWIYVTHSEWASAVEKRLGALIYRAEQRYVVLLLELIENIRTMSNTNESFGELLEFFQQHRAAISRAEKIRSQALEQTPDEIRKVLSPRYEVWWNTGAKREGWLLLQRAGNQRFRYVVGYYEVFHEDEKIPNYRIEFIADEAGTEPAKQWQAELLATEHAAVHGLLPDDRVAHHILGKTYQLTPDEYARFPQVIAEKLRTDWEPLEQFWLTTTKQPAS